MAEQGENDYEEIEILPIAEEQRYIIHSLNELKTKINLHLFESAIDFLSFATLEKFTDTYDGDLLSLSGVYMPKQNVAESTLPPALSQYLSDHPNTTNIHLHLDNDLAGRVATEAMMAAFSKQYTVTDEPPPSGKDYNEYLCDRKRLPRTGAQKTDYVR